MYPHVNKKLMGLQRKVANALKKFHNVEYGFYGKDWKVGRLIEENIYKNRNIHSFTEDECLLALKELKSS